MHRPEQHLSGEGALALLELTASNWPPLLSELLTLLALQPSAEKRLTMTFGVEPWDLGNLATRTAAQLDGLLRRRGPWKKASSILLPPANLRALRAFAWARAHRVEGRRKRTVRNVLAKLEEELEEIRARHLVNDFLRDPE